MSLPEYAGYPYERLTLITGSGDKKRVPYSSGLNWGQRPGRNPDQAYLAIPVHIQQSDFFPCTGKKFKVFTDDGEEWMCARRQANGKALHTVNDNSIIGKYFRKRLGVESGELVTLEHLVTYGRTSVEIYKKSLNEYILDFKSY